MAHFQPEPFWYLEVDLALLDGLHSSNPSETGNSSSSSSSSIGGHTQNDTTRAVGNGVKRGAEESKTVVAINNAHAPRLLRLEWVRHRVFDKRAAALLFQRATAGADTGTSNTLVVVSVKQRNTSRSRPQPLNTVCVIPSVLVSRACFIFFFSIGFIAFPVTRLILFYLLASQLIT